jgi:hypothetical protein
MQAHLFRGVAAACLAAGASIIELCAAQPLALHPDNHHYFLWRGQPTVLITSGEHYGAVLNLDFDYRKYLDALARDKLNLTRTFAGGAYVEPQGAFGIARNTLAPAPGRFLCPFARSGEPGYAGGGNKFDLTRWDDAFFKRFRDFVAHAGRRGVVVEVNLFCPMYEETQWKVSPFSTNNNVNGLGRIARTSVYTLDRHSGLLEVQERMTRKFVEELKEFDNVYYEICNEAYFGGVTLAWQHRIADIIRETELKFPARQRHLISQNIANNSAKVEKPHPAVSIFNFHYAAPPDAVEMNWHLNRVIGDNETGFRGTNDAPYRMEGWDFILAGGGLYNNLDYSFVAGQEDGTYVYPASQPGGGNPVFRRQMRVLRDFIHDLNFLRMKPDNSVIKGGVPVTLTARAMVEPARAYAVYLRPSVVTQFSVRWTGQIEAPESGEYTFHTYSNDGVRLWVGGHKVIDNWTEHGETEDTGRIKLEAGKRADLKLEYFYNGGPSVMKLLWSRKDVKKEPVPSAALWVPDGGAHGLRGEYFQGTKFEAPGPVRTDPQVNFAWGSKSPFKEAKAAPMRALELELPAGNYRAEWIDPPTGRLLKQERFKHAGGVKPIEAPAFSEDAALRVRQN